MPFTSLHKRQKSKNIALLVVLLVLMALFFGITVVRMGGAAN